MARLTRKSKEELSPTAVVGRTDGTNVRELLDRAMSRQPRSQSRSHLSCSFAVTSMRSTQ